MKEWLLSLILLLVGLSIIIVPMFWDVNPVVVSPFLHIAAQDAVPDHKLNAHINGIPELKAFALQTGNFVFLQKAQDQSHYLRQLGMPAFVIEQNNQFQVLVGPYTELQMAKRAQKNLTQAQLKSFMIKYDLIALKENSHE